MTLITKELRSINLTCCSLLLLQDESSSISGSWTSLSLNSASGKTADVLVFLKLLKYLSNRSSFKYRSVYVNKCDGCNRIQHITHMANKLINYGTSICIGVCARLPHSSVYARNRRSWMIWTMVPNCFPSSKLFFSRTSSFFRLFSKSSLFTMVLSNVLSYH